jgi:hypothetical protein
VFQSPPLKKPTRRPIVGHTPPKLPAFKAAISGFFAHQAKVSLLQKSKLVNSFLEIKHYICKHFMNTRYFWKIIAFTVYKK